MPSAYPFYPAGAPSPYGYPAPAGVPSTAPPPVPSGIPISATLPSTVPAAGAPAAAVPVAPFAPTPPGQLPIEESYIENILRLNLGKIATIYMTFENNPEWPAKVFRGRLEAAGRDHIIISDPDTGRRYLLLMVNLDYITFDEPLQYFYPEIVAPRRRFR